VVADVRYRGLEAPLDPVFYVPHAQNSVRAMNLVMRSSLPPSSVRAAIRRQIHALDGTIPVAEPRRIDDLLYESIAQPRFRTLLVGAFAALALAIAVVGLYGVISYGVTQRHREIAIRIALGARAGDVSTAILRQAAWLALAGVALGVAGAVALQTLLTEFLFEVVATDTATYAGAAAILLGVCVLASYLPARRAARVDPLLAMKAS
jgi:putative ABC transport system permease protein